MFKKIAFIINPASGTEAPILGPLNRAMVNTKILWEVFVTKKSGDAKRFARQALKDKTGAIAVYGGDGTVKEAAQALYRSRTPLAILPGGSANVVAKELAIPLNLSEALHLITSEKPTIKKIDMALLNNRPILLGFNIGILARAVQSSTPELKSNIGQLAYGLNAIKRLGKSRNVRYRLTLDGKPIRMEGVALFVVNIGNVGFTGFSLLPQVSVTDGLLDVILIEEINLASFMTWLKSSFTREMPDSSFRHWQARKIIIGLPRDQAIICDDESLAGTSFRIKAVKGALRVIVPQESR